MCIGLFVTDHPEYALILASNRDEFLARPTAPTAFHSFGLGESDGVADGFVLSGVDLKAGGTWLGMNRRGDIAMLTNVTESYPIGELPSRGDLTRNFLTRPLEQSLSHFTSNLLVLNQQYAGFNLLLLSPNEPSEPGKLRFESVLITNGGARGQIIAVRQGLVGGVCGVSNGVDLPDSTTDTEWPKVTEGKELMTEAVRSPNEEEMIAGLFGMLKWAPSTAVASREDLRNTILVRPLPIQPGVAYGTRLSTVLLVRKDGSVTWSEKVIFQQTNGRIGYGDGQLKEFHFQLR